MNRSLPIDIASKIIRPLFMLYLGVGEIIGDLGDDLYDLTEDDFTARVMSDSGGCLNPATVRSVYRALMTEAGFSDE